MPAYMVIQATVTNPDQFAEYVELIPAMIEKYGGRYRVQGGGEVETLEGEWGYQALVIVEYPSMDQARTMWHSDEYKELKKLREGAVDLTVLLADGL